MLGSGSRAVKPQSCLPDRCGQRHISLESFEKQPDRRDTGGSGPCHRVDSIERDAADRENRDRNGPDDGGEPLDAETLAQTGLDEDGNTVPAIR